MKTFTHIIIAFFAISSSCGDQEINQNITLNYNAQTRGYSYKISLVNYSLEINNNNSIKTATLDKSHLIKRIKSRIAYFIIRISLGVANI